MSKSENNRSLRNLNGAARFQLCCPWCCKMLVTSSVRAFYFHRDGSNHIHVPIQHTNNSRLNSVPFLDPFFTGRGPPASVVIPITVRRGLTINFLLYYKARGGGNRLSSRNPGDIVVFRLGSLHSAIINFRTGDAALACRAVNRILLREEIDNNDHFPFFGISMYRLTLEGEYNLDEDESQFILTHQYLQTRMGSMFGGRRQGKFFGQCFLKAYHMHASSGKLGLGGGSPMATTTVS
ncbi:hypothetical protein NLI96_g12198 [Meripilus lineatus]|uniref:Uncharacterized protein n=1 Tax=Meripilus lineatus TaxID=2056292 RepID=A0AAD5YCM7_9APHY|nr:hypothetical protein NLI96_g12198 [Physisporinus lineatus]